MTRSKTKDEWRKEMALTKNDYEARRVATLNHIRLKWTNRSDLDPKIDEHRIQLKDHIRPLVKRYTSAKKKLPPMSDEERLESYTQWAFQVNNQSREEYRGGRKGEETQHFKSDTKTQVKNQEAPYKETETCDTIAHAEDQANYQDSSQQEVEELKTDLLKPSARSSARTLQVSDSTPTKLPPTPTTNTPLITTVDWDNIEVVVDADILGLDVTWLPMINLKPDAVESCHWKDFEIKALLTNFERDTGKKLDMTVHEFVYGKFAFSRQGGYSVALKRFAALGERRGETFHLRVEAKEKSSNTGDGHRANTPDSTILVRRPRGAKSSFNGSLSDYSADEESDTPPAKKRR